MTLHDQYFLIIVRRYPELGPNASAVTIVISARSAFLAESLRPVLLVTGLVKGRPWQNPAASATPLGLIAISIPVVVETMSRHQVLLGMVMRSPVNTLTGLTLAVEPISVCPVRSEFGYRKSLVASLANLGLFFHHRP